MIQLSDEQLNNLGKEALVVIVSFLQDQLLALQSQLDHANAQLSDNNRQIIFIHNPCCLYRHNNYTICF